MACSNFQSAEIWMKNMCPLFFTSDSSIIATHNNKASTKLFLPTSIAICNFRPNQATLRQSWIFFHQTNSYQGFLSLCFTELLDSMIEIFQRQIINFHDAILFDIIWVACINYQRIQIEFYYGRSGGRRKAFGIMWTLFGL